MKNLKFFKKFSSLVLLIILPSFLLCENSLNGEEIFKKRCSGCHGIDGTAPAYGISRKLTEIPQEELKEKLKFYTSKEVLAARGVTAVMGKQTAKLNKQEYDEVLSYITNAFSVKN